jgi:hypothetical protein
MEKANEAWFIFMLTVRSGGDDGRPMTELKTQVKAHRGGLRKRGPLVNSAGTGVPGGQGLKLTTSLQSTLMEERKREGVEAAAGAAVRRQAMLRDVGSDSA